MSDIPMYLRDIPKAERAIRHVEQDLARLRDAEKHIAVREGELKMLKGHLAELLAMEQRRDSLSPKEPTNDKP